MASTAAKAKRRAEAVNRLDDLAVQVAEHFGVEVPQLQTKSADPELEQIIQMEETANLLSAILKASGAEVVEPAKPEATDEIEEASIADEKPAAKKANKKSRKSRRK